MACIILPGVNRRRLSLSSPLTSGGVAFYWSFDRTRTSFSKSGLIVPPSVVGTYVSSVGAFNDAAPRVLPFWEANGSAYLNTGLTAAQIGFGGATPRTLAIRYRHLDNADLKALFSTGSNATRADFTIRKRSYSHVTANAWNDDLDFQVNQGFSDYETLLVVTYDGGTALTGHARSYQLSNGAKHEYTSTRTLGGQLNTTPTVEVRIGTSTALDITFNDRLISVLTVSGRVWTARDVSDYWADPDRIFDSPARRIYVPSAGTGGAVSVSPGVGALSITGHAPTVQTTSAAAVSVGLGALSVTGHAPTVTTQSAVSAGVGALAITGHAPTVDTTTSTAISVGAGALAVAGLAPTVTTQNVVAAGAGSLSITGYAPSVQVVSEGQIAVPAAALTLTGHAPTVTQQIVVSPSVAALAITGHVPTASVVSDATVSTGVGALTIAGHAPTVSILLAASTGTGQIVITGHAPTVTGGTASFVARQEAGGGKSRPSRRRRRYEVEIDGQVFDVESVEEAKQLLQEAEDLAAKKADEQLEKAAQAKKPRRKVVQDARKALKLPDIRVVGSDTDPLAAAIEQEMRQAFERIRHQYDEAVRAIEIGAFLRRQQQEEEDDAMALLLMTL